MTLTHSPFYSTPLTQPNTKEKFRHSKAEKFKENVEYMDKLVGRIVAGGPPGPQIQHPLGQFGG